MTEPSSTERTARDDLVALLAEMRAENGPATAAEEAWAWDVLGLSGVSRCGHEFDR